MLGCILPFLIIFMNFLKIFATEFQGPCWTVFIFVFHRDGQVLVTESRRVEGLGPDMRPIVLESWLFHELVRDNWAIV